MKNVWKGMFRRRRKEEYIPECWEVQLQETAEYIRNPGQGWYKIYTYDAGVPFDIEDEKASNEEQLALVRISLERYRTERITQEGIENIRRILRFFDADDVSCKDVSGRRFRIYGICGFFLHNGAAQLESVFL